MEYTNLGTYCAHYGVLRSGHKLCSIFSIPIWFHKKILCFTWSILICVFTLHYIEHIYLGTNPASCGVFYLGTYFTQYGVFCSETNSSSYFLEIMITYSDHMEYSDLGLFSTSYGVFRSGCIFF